MPPDLVRACRAAWEPFADRPQSVVHGDLNPSNLLRTRDGGAALLDWDEARADGSWFDLRALEPGGARGDAGAEQRALDAWEIAVCWLVEPDHARRLAARFG